MVTCSRCQHPIDDPTRTTCPLCYTPLPIQAVSYGSPMIQNQPMAAPRPGYDPAPASGGLPPLPDYIAQSAPRIYPGSPAPARPAPYRASNGWSSYMKMRLAIGAVGLTIALFAYI